MKKKARTLIILGAVLVLCVGAYIGVSIYTANETQKSIDAAEPAALYAVERDEPVKISYGSGDINLSFVLENDRWFVMDNKEFPLNQTALTNIASTLNNLSAVRTIDMPSSLSTYGLDQPLYTLSASDTSGNAMQLLIGAQISSNYYAVTEGDNKVYTIPPTLIGYLNTDILSMIALDTLPVLSEATMDTIKFASDTFSITLNKHTNKDGTFTWFIVSGTTVTAANEFILPAGSEHSPENYISNAVTGLSSAKFASCAAFNPLADALKTFGLDLPVMTVTVDYRSSTGSGTMDQATTKGTAALEIGGALSDGSGYYARIQGSQQINVLLTDTAEPLIAAFTALRTR